MERTFRLSRKSTKVPFPLLWPQLSDNRAKIGWLLFALMTLNFPHTGPNPPFHLFGWYPGRCWVVSSKVFFTTWHLGKLSWDPFAVFCSFFLLSLPRSVIFPIAPLAFVFLRFLPALPAFRFAIVFLAVPVAQMPLTLWGVPLFRRFLYLKAVDLRKPFSIFSSPPLDSLRPFPFLFAKPPPDGPPLPHYPFPRGG